MQSVASTRDPMDVYIFLTSVAEGNLEKVKENIKRNQTLLTVTYDLFKDKSKLLPQDYFKIVGTANRVFELVRGMNALHIARARNDLPMMRHLLSYKPEAASIINDKDSHGRTPLHSSDAFRHDGSDIRFKMAPQEDWNPNPIHSEMVKLLLENGANINLIVNTTPDFRYPLNWWYQDHPECLRLLINSVQAKANEVLKSALLPNLYNDIISIIISYNIAAEVDRFVNQKIGSTSLLSGIFSEFSKDGAYPAGGGVICIVTRTEERIEAAKILIDHGADLLAPCRHCDLHCDFNDPSRERDTTILDEIRDLTAKNDPLAKNFKEELSIVEDIQKRRSRLIDEHQEERAAQEQIEAQGGCCTIS